MITTNVLVLNIMLSLSINGNETSNLITKPFSLANACLALNVLVNQVRNVTIAKEAKGSFHS